MTEEDTEVLQRGRGASPIPFFHNKCLACLVTWHVEGDRMNQHHLVPPCPQPHTFNAADDFEAAGGEPIGDEEEDGYQGGIEQAVVVQGCPLHGSIPCACLCPLPSPAVQSGAALSQQPFCRRSWPPQAGRRGAARAGRQVIGSSV